MPTTPATRQPSIGVLGTGSYLPAREVTNEEVAPAAGVTPEWIERKTQIMTRRYAAPDEATSDLATHAAADALKQAGIPADRVDYIVVATSTPDSPQPPTVALVQQRLGASRSACFDMNVVCSGFVYGLAVGHRLLQAAPGSYALVIGADVYSRILNAEDRTTVVLFGDGAGAAVLGPVPSGYGVVDVGLHTRGDAHDLITVPAGGSRRPPTHDTVASGAHYFTMQGRLVRDFVLQEVPPALATLAERAGVGKSEIDHFVAHQANGSLLDELVVRAGLEKANVHRTVHDYGNVGAASVPVTLDKANRSGALGDGDLVLLAGFGGGMAIGACLLRWFSPS